MTKYLPTDQEFAAMRESVVNGVSAWERTRTRHRKVGVVCAVSIAAVATAGAAWAALASPQLRDDAVYCYSEANQSSVFATVVNPEAESPDGPEELDASAIELCEAAWRAGVVGQPAQSSEGVQFPVPELQACVRLDGVTAVFPSDDRPEEEFCRELGLRAP
ncbi:hypothetical protein [Agromyces sp. SYSU T00194]|uniref:hypothetical protein n=1 Tax=Agromyces chitinivorans TaxID=3158560 RepID=UPI00339A011E